MREANLLKVNNLSIQTSKLFNLQNLNLYFQAAAEMTTEIGNLHQVNAEEVGLFSVKREMELLSYL